MIQKTFTTDQQPEGLRADLKLHKYQREAVAWMKTIEDDAKKRMGTRAHAHTHTRSHTLVRTLFFTRSAHAHACTSTSSRPSPG